MLERWNDDKMDALEAKVGDMDVRLARVEVRVADGFEKVDAELLEQRREMKAGFERMDERFERMDERFERINDRLTYALVAVMGAGATIAAAIFTTSLV